MAIINDQTKFDPDAIPSPVVGIAAAVGQHDSGMHRHNKGQLLYAPQGCITFALQDMICVLPPNKAVWIPPGTVHRAIMTNVVEYRSLYFDGEVFCGPSHIVVIEVNELLRALINTMALWPWENTLESCRYYSQLFWHEFQHAKRHSYRLPLPQDKRLVTLVEAIKNPDYLLPDLVSLATQIGASSKTITRIFKAQTGMTYQEWKQQWRLIKSIELLCQLVPVAEVAHQLDFSSDSAFIAFFKKLTGQTPLAFVKNQSSINS